MPQPQPDAPEYYRGAGSETIYCARHVPRMPHRPSHIFGDRLTSLEFIDAWLVSDITVPLCAPCRELRRRRDR